MKWFYILVGILLLLNTLVVVLCLCLGKDLPSDDDDDRRYYDEDGNHIYYDRKLIAYLEREKEKENKSH